MVHRAITLVAVMLISLTACGTTDQSPVESMSSTVPKRAHDVRTGYVLGPTGEAVAVKFEVIGNLAVREGDIILGHADSIASTPDELKRRGAPSFGVYLDPTSTNRWPNGVVPYIISVSDPQRIIDAMAHVKANTPGIDFRAISESEAQSGAAFVRFVPHATMCGSPVIGRQASGEQQVVLAVRCTKVDVIHEIGHVLGMQHEHMRCDRDQHVKILWHNIHYTNHFQFDIKCPNYTDFAEYNEGSIMHYSAYAFTVDGSPTIESLRGRAAEMGTAVGLARSDVSTLSLMYRPLTQVHRWYNPNLAGGDHLYTLNPSEGWAHGYTLEDGDYFRVTSATGSHYARLYRCLVNSHHYLSKSSTCEVGVPAEGTIGRVATWEMGGTVPLYRTRHPVTGDRLATTSASERTATLNSGWINEGILGYVWPGN